VIANIADYSKIAYLEVGNEPWVLNRLLNSNVRGISIYCYCERYRFIRMLK